MIIVLIIMLISVFAMTVSILEVYFIVKIFKDEFGCFSLDSLITGEWDNENLKTGKVRHYVASIEISKHISIIFLSLFSIAVIFDWV